jgi:hypothetical protein
VSDHFDPNEDFDLDGEYFDPEQLELFREPDDEIDREERDKAMEEWAAEATPDDWWQDQLNSAHDAECLESIVELLVREKCRRVDLLLALQAITIGYWDPLPTRQQLLDQANAYLELGETVPLSSGDDFRLADWDQMQGLMLRCAQHLRARADSSKLNHKMLRRDLVVKLLVLVRRQTGRPYYRRLSELLLALVGDKTLTPTTLRKMTSRRGVTKQRALRPIFKRRRPLTSGVPVRRDEYYRQQRAQAEIEVGNRSERHDDWTG